MFRLMLGAICVFAAAAPMLANSALADTAPATNVNLAGRWQGESYAVDEMSRLTLDIVSCGQGWCGIMVGADQSCGETALKLDAGGGDGGSVVFKGTLALAPDTEPYVIQSYLADPTGDAPVKLHIVGDTGGTFRIFRRSFPYEAQLVRTSDAVCKSEQTVSMILEAAD